MHPICSRSLSKPQRHPRECYPCVDSENRHLHLHDTCTPIRAIGHPLCVVQAICARMRALRLRWRASPSPVWRLGLVLQRAWVSGSSQPSGASNNVVRYNSERNRNGAHLREKPTLEQETLVSRYRRGDDSPHGNRATWGATRAQSTCGRRGWGSPGRSL